jgi:hypothetical protein
MQLTTSYREQSVGVLKGTKSFYLVCHVNFTAEERAVIQERGMYDENIVVASATPPPTRAGDFGAAAMRGVGLLLMVGGFLGSCATGIAGSNASTPLFGLFILGVILFVVGKMKDRAANKREENPAQTLTLRQLLANPEFIVYAPALDVAKIYEEHVREELSKISHVIKQSVVVPEKNTYDL